MSQHLEFFHSMIFWYKVMHIISVFVKVSLTQILFDFIKSSLMFMCNNDDTNNDAKKEDTNNDNRHNCVGSL